jgi:hypothetical protein
MIFAPSFSGQYAFQLYCGQFVPVVADELVPHTRTPSLVKHLVCGLVSGVVDEPLEFSDEKPPEARVPSTERGEIHQHDAGIHVAVAIQVGFGRDSKVLRSHCRQLGHDFRAKHHIHVCLEDETIFHPQFLGQSREISYKERTGADRENLLLASRVGDLLQIG